eukprot:CAMPEP_0183293050 /NCGR_PEP_ID=MMETSP0160_2-20130417/1890_1 /TAXON_ID=2839 ORGANISM="Odontella Sinensis, Strain Grunow 1884" /NCGR_SAMPLE_ID=MMETSP0160_2 /ASSEMBLY_ACC=CAM_ASM_000250 /LENGTH=392 /DNA_ID=CAMNT_0025454107 /DNA_START=76 /DNA_END=1254 /DNA_ORIENTATION=+
MVRFALVALAALVAQAAATANVEVDATGRILQKKKKKSDKMSKGGKGDDEVTSCQGLDNGYDIWQQADPADIEMKVETTVNAFCEYEIKMSYKPSDSIPYMMDNEKVDDPVPPEQEAALLAPFLSDDDSRAAWRALCMSEGVYEFDLVPGFPEESVGTKMYNTEYTHTIQLSAEDKEITGTDHVTVGATPCGTRLQTYSHYNIHFYFSSIEERRQMTCVTGGGYFCRDSKFQTCGTGTKFNTDGSTPKCEDGVTPANIPVGHTWTDDGSLPFPGYKTGAAAAGQGHHALNLRTLDDVNYRPMDMPNFLMLNYDRTVSAAHMFYWAGFPLGHSHTNMWEWPENPIMYNCWDEVQYKRLPRFMGAVYDPATGRTTHVIRGAAGKCGEYSNVIEA